MFNESFAFYHGIFKAENRLPFALTASQRKSNSSLGIEENTVASKAVLTDRLIIYLNLNSRVSLSPLKEKQPISYGKVARLLCQHSPPQTFCTAQCYDKSIGAQKQRTEGRLGSLLPFE